MISISTLMLNGNCLTRLPPSLAKLQELSVANFANNNIRFMPRILAHTWANVLPDSVTARRTPGTTPGTGGLQSSPPASPQSASAAAAAPMLSPDAAGPRGRGDEGDQQAPFMTPPAVGGPQLGAGVQLRLDGNPVLNDVGAALTESQFTQPMVKTWNKKQKH